MAHRRLVELLRGRYSTSGLGVRALTQGTMTPVVLTGLDYQGKLGGQGTRS